MMGLPCDYTKNWYDAPGVPARAPQPQRTANVWAGYAKVESDDDIPKVSPPSKLPAK